MITERIIDDRDADWRTSPDLMTVDDKLDAAFGPQTPDERQRDAETLFIGRAMYRAPADGDR